MIVDLVLLYSFIVAVALIRFLYNRYALFAQLSKGFLAFQQKNDLHSFMSIHQTKYIAQLFYLALEVLVVGFSLFRLLYLIDLLHIETGLIASVLVFFYAKERFSYITAVFVKTRDLT